MNVLSFADAAQRLAPLEAEITQISAASAADLGQTPPTSLRFREGDDVQVIYQAAEGRGEIRSVMYGPTNKEVVKALCRTLGRTADQIIAAPAGDPRPFDLTWILIAPTQPNADFRLARVRGISAVQLNMALGWPVERVEHDHTSGRAWGLSAAGPAAAEPLPTTFLEPGDDE